MDPTPLLGLLLLLLLLLLVGAAPGLASVPYPGNNANICLLPKKEGPCRALMPRFFYDRYLQKCHKFNYGGCYGNANNFHSLKACEETCGMIEEVRPVCRLEVNEYPCNKPNEQYFFDLSTMTCRKLMPGLCNKNANVFPDEATCKGYCLPKTGPSYCYSPKDEGLCSSNITRYYFNPRNKACETFTYTGCGGNNNNFYYQEDCYHACAKGTKRKLRLWKPYA
uniref:Tissue factor pathway inhibitor n=1 Tax=Nannospalax galili TaxID=1026970 RepID=A0A8C6RSW4_NANGA